MPASPEALWLEWTVMLLIRLRIVLTRLMPPLVRARALGRAVGAGLYYLNGRMRRVAIRSLELAYPKWLVDHYDWSAMPLLDEAGLN